MASGPKYFELNYLAMSSTSCVMKKAYGGENSKKKTRCLDTINLQFCQNLRDSQEIH